MSTNPQTLPVLVAGAGIQLEPNGFAAFDALGIGERARARAVCTGVERARRQPQTGAELLRRHLSERTPVDRTAEGLEALRMHDRGFDAAFTHCQRSRMARTARVVLSAREKRRIFHAQGVERLVRYDLWRGRSPERFYDAMEWRCGWRVENCLSSIERTPA